MGLDFADRKSKNEQMRTKALEIPIVLLAVFPFFAGAAFTADVFSGTWTLNTSKTTADQFAIPVIEKIDADDNGIKAVAVDSVGRTHVEYAVKFDGMDYPYRGMGDRKAIVDAPDTTCSAKRINDYTIEFTIKVRDLAVARIIARQIMSVSKDGKTRTVTQVPVGQSPSNQPRKVIVWEKH